MASTYLTKTKRAQLIDQYVDCWWDTAGYQDASDQDEACPDYVRNQLEAMNNSELVAFIKSSGWDIN
jgi:predicted GTPase